MTCADANWGEVAIAIPIVLNRRKGWPWTIGTGIPNPTPLEACYDFLLIYEKGPPYYLYGGATGLDILMGRGLRTYDKRHTLENESLRLTCARAVITCQPLDIPVRLVTPAEFPAIQHLLASVPQHPWTFDSPYRIYWMRYWRDHDLIVRDPASGIWTVRWLLTPPRAEIKGI